MRADLVSRSDLVARRRSAFVSLRGALSQQNLEDVNRCAAKLYATLPQRDGLEENVVLVAYGGGKDSSYTLAFVRAMQLHLFEVYRTTFSMRVVTNRHAGMPSAVMENIDRAYRALDLPADPDCALLIVDGNEVRTFSVSLPRQDHVVQRNRLDILMTGHRTFADGRPTFCNACNLSMVNSFGLAATIDGGVDLIITGDSQREQRAYYLWVNKLVRKFGQEFSGQQGGFRGFLTAVDAIARSYFTNIHGSEEIATIAERRLVDVPPGLRFFSIYDETSYSLSDHWELLTNYLGFQFDDLAFSFTESDCGNPALMAHLRGLKAERLFRRHYRDGMSEYVNFALSLMRKKEFPDSLIEMMRERYSDDEALGRMRKQANVYAAEAYGLTEEHLISMACSPFAGRGRGLVTYLAREQPEFEARAGEVHAILACEDDHVSPSLVKALGRMSGLELRQLRVLYRSELRKPSVEVGGEDLLGSILDGDPHKGVIQTQHAPDGPLVLELLSGR